LLFTSEHFFPRIVDNFIGTESCNTIRNEMMGRRKFLLLNLKINVMFKCSYINLNSITF
jgi:hypothetical protein